MKARFNDIEALIETGGVTGEWLLDEVLGALVRNRDVLRPEELARAMDVDVDDLRGAVRLLTGRGLRELITEWRMLEARQMLQRGTLQPAEVARRCGWRSLQTMKATFRRMGYPSGWIIDAARHGSNAPPGALTPRATTAMLHPKH